jgi:glycosyltransferase involved in cell wall biosynthesis
MEPHPIAPSKRRLRVLLSAFAFDASGGSEAGLGWQIARCLAREHDVTVISGHLHLEPKDPAILAITEQACRDTGHITSVFVEGNAVAKRLAALSAKPGMWWLYYLGYRKWQEQALAKAKELHAAEPFDLTHHLNYIGYREPGDLWQLGIPHFWGPISGSPMVPWAFLKTFSPGQFYRWGGRNLGNWWQMRRSARCKAAAKASSRIWAVSESDRLMVETHWHQPAEHLLETGGEFHYQRHIRRLGADQPLRLIWSGRFDPIKVLPVIFEALNGLLDHAWELHVLGDGPESIRWRPLADSLPIRHRIVWHGMVPRDKALDVMNDGHVFLHSSVKEGTPHVVVEALALGLPVLCHDACGMGIAVDARCGIKIPLQDPATSSSGFRDAIRRLLTEPELLPTLSAGAYERAAELSWDSKVETFTKAYREATSTTA